MVSVVKSRDEQNYYSILEVSPHASDEEIRIAYEKLKATYSPNAPGIYALFTPEEVKEVLTKVEEAYQILSNPHSRREYDLVLKGGKKRPATPPPTSTVSHRVLDDEEVRKALGSKEVIFSGNNLRKIRRYLSLKVDDIAKETKIGKAHLKAIEEEDIHSLPALVYLKGFLKTYATILGLDPYQVTEQYLARITEKGY